MKNLLVSIVVLALVSVVLAALVLAGFGVAPSFVALPAVGFAGLVLAYLASRTETVLVVERIEITFERVSRPFPTRAFAAIVVAVPSVSLVVLALFFAIAV